jgi:hypothetical protein
MKVGTLQVSAWVVWLSSYVFKNLKIDENDKGSGCGVTRYWVSVSWPANMAG